jgi:PAS domain S-box-containing protein
MLDATLIIDWDGTILFANPATFELVGADINVEIGHFKVMDFAHPDYVESIIKHQELVKKGKGGFFAEYQFQTLLGEDKWVEGLGTKIKFQGRSANLVTLRDITERKKFEDQLTNSLKEKEILIQEIHHRVKNNLQIISSLLNLQTRFTDDKDTYNQLMESQSRIMAMAMIHETLYQSHNIASLDFGEYIDKLCKQLFQTYYAETRVQLDITIKNTNLSINTAIPLGLILTELVINSLKYAFPEYGNGTITISINEAGSEYQLVIADDGIGFPADIDPENTDTLGLKLVHTLVNQIDGSVKMDSTSGTKYIISFEKDDP